MNEQETGRLLVMAKTLDPWFPAPDDAGFVLRLWVRSLDDVPMQAAEDALAEYYRSNRYRESRQSIMPADIVQWYRDRRRYQAEKRERPALNPERLHAGVDRALAELARRKAITAGEDPELAADIAEGETSARRQFRSVRCPHCGALPGKQCTLPGSTRPLTKLPAHHARQEAALAGQAASAITV